MTPAKSFIVLILSFASTGPLNAQWSSDPSHNLVIAQGVTGVPEITGTTDRHYFITWFKGSNRITYLALQVLNFDGKQLHANGGMLVSDHPQSGFKYDLEADKKDNALIASSDSSNGGDFDITIYKMDTYGNHLWGVDGITFPFPGTNEHGPIIAVNPDNSVTLAYARYGKRGIPYFTDIILYRISEDGSVQWDSEPKVIKGLNISLSLIGVMSLDDGGALITFWEGPYDHKHSIRVKKVDKTGRDAWLKDLEISGSSYVGTYTQTYNGEDGILYITWNQRIQGVTQDGNLLWPEPGIFLTANGKNSASNPIVQGLTSRGDVLVAWQDATDGYQTVFGQLVSREGELKWGNSGLELKRRCNGFSCSVVHDTIIMVFHDPDIHLDIFRVIKAKAFDLSGTPCWPGEVMVSDQYTAKSISGFTKFTDGQGALVIWDEGRDGTPWRVLAQNIRTDGTLGLKSTGITVIPDNQFRLKIYFSPPDHNILIDVPGGNQDIMVYNTMGNLMFRQQIKNTGQVLTRIETAGWKTGIYLVQVLNDGRKTGASKVMVLE